MLARGSFAEALWPLGRSLVSGNDVPSLHASSLYPVAVSIDYVAMYRRSTRSKRQGPDCPNG